jgi:hypothetical protein
MVRLGPLAMSSHDFPPPGLPDVDAFLLLIVRVLSYFVDAYNGECVTASTYYWYYCATVYTHSYISDLSIALPKSD